MAGHLDQALALFSSVCAYVSSFPVCLFMLFMILITFSFVSSSQVIGLEGRLFCISQVARNHIYEMICEKRDTKPYSSVVIDVDLLFTADWRL